MLKKDDFGALIGTIRNVDRQFRSVDASQRLLQRN